MKHLIKYGKFLPKGNEKFTVYHGSRKLFDNLSNQFNRTGNGKNIYGWGIYTSKDINHASWFAQDYHWCPLYNNIIIDGKIYYTKNILHDSIYDTIVDRYYANVDSRDSNALYFRLMKIPFTDILNHTVDKDLMIEAYTLIEDDIIRNNKRGKYLIKEILKKLETCKKISFKSENPGYIYECEVTPRKIYPQVLTATDKHFLKGQLRKEGIEGGDKFFERGDYTYYNNDFYRNLVDYYMDKVKRRGRKNIYRDEFEKKASLFLYRCGYDMIECPGNEYVVIDINSIKIKNVIKV